MRNSRRKSFIFCSYSGETLPILLLEPAYVACYPQTVIALRQSPIELVHPAIINCLRRKSAIPEVPLVVRGDVNLTALKVSAEIGQSLSQSLPGLLFIRRFGSDLETEFVICQPCFEVGHQNIEQVFFGLVKVAGVCTPGYITDNINTRNSPFVSHLSYPLGQIVAAFMGHITYYPTCQRFYTAIRSLSILPPCLYRWRNQAMVQAQ